MAFQYTPHDWIPNEIITEEKLDHLESGVVDLVEKLKPVAETGSYNDLTDKPQINGKELSGNVAIDSMGFHQVATSGSYNDLNSKPSINGHELTGAQTTDSLDLRYTLPNANEDTLGGIKVGERLSINEDGKLSVEAKLSQYTNDSEFQTKTEVVTAINNAQHLKKKKVDVLPPAEEMEDDIIYLVPAEKTEEDNIYDEYIKIDDKAELIGTTKIDLTEYAKLTDLDELVTGGSIDGFTLKLDKKDASQIEIQLPQNLSEFTNDEDFATKTEVQIMIDESGGGESGGGNFKVEVVDEIPQPTQMNASTIYLVPRLASEENDKYDEYVLVNDSVVERMGGGTLDKEQLLSLIAKAAKHNINISSPVWSPDGELFKAVVEVTDLNLDDNNYGFIADVIQSGDEEQDALMRDNWNSIVRMTIEGTQLTIYSEVEFETLNIQLLILTIGESSSGPVVLPDNLVSNNTVLENITEAKITTLVDNTTKDVLVPRTKLEAISGVGTEGQLIGFTGENSVGIITSDSEPTEGSVNPVQSGGVYEANKWHTNKNLLDNWYFVGGGSQLGGGKLPINQRGQTEYTAAAQYSIDRWKLFANPRVTLLDAGLKFENLSAEGMSFFEQTINTKNTFFEGKTITVSLLDNEGNLYTNTVKRTTGWDDKAVDFGIIRFQTSETQNLSLVVLLNAETEKTFVAAKLEFGDKQTLARKEGDEWVLNDPPPDFAAELAKCQMYYYKFKPNNNSTTGLVATTWEASTVFGYINIPTPMRILPTMNVNYTDINEHHLRTHGDIHVISDIHTVDMSGMQIMFQGTLDTATTPGTPGIITLSEFELDANL